MAIFWRSGGALAAAMLLSGCLVTPGRFESALDIRADRSFTFSYKGEIIASDVGKDAMTSGAVEPTADDGSAKSLESAYDDAQMFRIADADRQETFGDAKTQDDSAQMQAIAAALVKEKGFRSARYLGQHKFAIDYAISGRLTHAFLFPFNIDAQIILPFIAVELRGDDKVRVKAPGFSNGFDKSQGPAMGAGGPGEDAAKALDGVFTLTTDAEIISQNQEDGASSIPAGQAQTGKQIRWRITPLTSDAPTATLRLR
ncbi:hypothetical protein WG907_03230 [Sphingobium sp. AN558]|uniref:hypothetical protein n=1 Tax=Sphingobium sp. AN558 TaxID=3133442 RepID=UPI0030BB1633